MSVAVEAERHTENLHVLTDDELRVLRRFIGGTVGGVLQAASSHPFDTIKSCVQNGLYPNIRVCVRSLWRSEGFYGFYRGVTPPLFLGGVYNSLLFSLNQWMANWLTPKGHDMSQPLPLWRTAVAAQLTAPLYVLAITPTEKVKVQLQTEGKSGGQATISGPVACLRQIVRREGFTGLLSGYFPTVASRVLGLPAFFVGYQLTKEALMETYLCATPSGREVVVPMLSGVMAGFCFWFSCYPCDFVKTRIQASRVKLRAADVIRTTYRVSGMRGFYKGFSACLLRSAPANASLWLGVELSTKFLNSKGW